MVIEQPFLFGRYPQAGAQSSRAKRPMDHTELSQAAMAYVLGGGSLSHAGERVLRQPSPRATMTAKSNLENPRNSGEAT
jgi:hypothetical protein